MVLCLIFFLFGLLTFSFDFSVHFSCFTSYLTYLMNPTINTQQLVNLKPNFVRPKTFIYVFFYNSGLNGQYSRAVYNQERVMMERLRYIFISKLVTRTKSYIYLQHLINQLNNNLIYGLYSIILATVLHCELMASGKRVLVMKLSPPKLFGQRHWSLTT